MADSATQDGRRIDLMVPKKFADEWEAEAERRGMDPRSLGWHVIETFLAECRRRRREDARYESPC